MKYKLILGLFLALIFLGCENKIYTKIYDKKLAKEKIECLKLTSDNLIIEDVVKNHPFIKKLLKNSCPYSLKITSNYITSCSSAKAKALGSDFDGFVRFDIYKDGIHIYRNQRDFKGKFTNKIADSLINKMREDLNFGD